jgi:putative endonuclease
MIIQGRLKFSDLDIYDRLCHTCEGRYPGNNCHKIIIVKMNRYYIYILASNKNGTLYIGVTSDLVKRVYEHKNKLFKGFTSKYDVSKLIYFEETSDIYSAISREKQLKKWKRQWKMNLIEKKILNGMIYMMI